MRVGGASKGAARCIAEATISSTYKILKDKTPTQILITRLGKQQQIYTGSFHIIIKNTKTFIPFLSL